MSSKRENKRSRSPSRSSRHDYYDREQYRRSRYQEGRSHRRRRSVDKTSSHEEYKWKDSRRHRGFNDAKPPLPSTLKPDDDALSPKPNFNLSGALAADKRTGNYQVHVKSQDDPMPQTLVSKYSIPRDAMDPAGGWRFFVFPEDGPPAETLTLYLHRKSHFIFGSSNALCDFDLEPEAECDSEHAVIQYRKQEAIVYLMDLDTQYGTKLNRKPVEAARYIELRDGDVLNFGKSRRDFVLKRGLQ